LAVGAQNAAAARAIGTPRDAAECAEAARADVDLARLDVAGAARREGGAPAEPPDRDCGELADRMDRDSDSVAGGAERSLGEADDVGRLVGRRAQHLGPTRPNDRDARCRWARDAAVARVDLYGDQVGTRARRAAHARELAHADSGREDPHEPYAVGVG